MKKRLPLPRLKFLLAALMIVSGLSALAQNPNPPTGLIVTSTPAGGLTVNFSAPGNLSNCDNYVILVKGPSGAFPTIADGTGQPADDADLTDGNGVKTTANNSTTTATFTNASLCTTYDIRVYSHKNGGDKYSTVLAGTSVTISANLTAIPGTFTLGSAVNANNIDLTFTKASKLPFDAKGYLIFRKAGSAADFTGLTDGEDPGTSSITDINTTYIANVDSTKTTYTDVGPFTGGITYHYVLVPYNACLNVSNAAISGTYNYQTASTLTTNSTFPLKAVITQETGGTSDPVVGGDNDKALIGFSFTSNGTQNVTGATFTLSTDPATLKLTNFELWESDNATYPGTGSVIASTGNGKLAVSTTTVTITGITATTSKFYFLRADVAADAAASTFDIEFTSATVGAGSITTTAPFFSKTNIDIQVLTATIANLNTPATHGVAADGLVGGTTGKPILGFSLTSTGSAQNVTAIKVSFDANPDNFYTNYSLVVSTNNNADASGNTTVTLSGAPAVTGSGPYTLTFTPNTPITLGATQNFFVFVDVKSSVSTGADQIQGSLASTGLTIASSAGSVTGSATGIDYDFTGLTTTMNQLTTGIASSPLAAGSAGSASANAILGFSLQSNGSQTATAIKFRFTADPYANYFTSFGLVTSNDASFSTTASQSLVAISSATPAATDLSGTGVGPWEITITPNSAIDISTIQYLFLVATIDGDANSASLTPSSITPSITTAGLTLSPAAVTANSFSGTAYSFAPSSASTIAIHSTSGVTNNIAFATYNANTASSGLTWGGSPNSTSLANFRIRDGGGAADADTQGTTITDLTFTISNPGDLNAVAVFSGSSIANTNIKIAEVPIGTGTISLSSLSLTAPDDGDWYITVRATFAAKVTDNNTHVVVITAATATSAGSALSGTPLTLATTGTGSTINNITVAATKLIFVDPSDVTGAIFNGPVNVTPNSCSCPTQNFDVNLYAVDANGNRDLNNTASINALAIAGGSGALTGGAGVSLVNGAHSYTNLSISLAGTYTLSASDGVGGLSDANSVNSTSVSVQVISLGVKITDGLTASVATTNLCYGGDFQTLGTIKITESDPADFSTGSSQSLSLILPAGYVFDPSITTAPTLSGTEISAASALTYLSGNTIVRFTYTISGTSNINSITISGLKVKYTLTSAPTETDILRVGGTASQAGNADSDAKVHGVINTTQASNAGYNFFVQEFPGQTAIQQSETRFSSNTAGIKLFKDANNPPTTSDVFSGNGVSFSNSQNSYVFSPTSVGVGSSYVVTYTAQNASGCQISVSKTFQVYASSINGLKQAYCINDNTTQTLSVDNSVYNSASYTLTGDYAIYVPSYKYIQKITNNGAGTLTINIPNHGFSNGQTLYMYAYAYDFSFTLKLNVPYQAYVISNVTTNDFDISYFYAGSGTYSNSTGYFYGYSNLPSPTVTGVAGIGTTTLTITAPNHGLPNGVRVLVNLGGIDENAGAVGNIYNWYTISNSTVNTFQINTTGTVTGVWNGGGYVDIFNYRITSFVPSSVSSLNSNFGSITDIYVGFLVTSNSCVIGPGNTCNALVYSNEPVKLNQLPSLDFSILSSSYCTSDLAVTLTGNQPDGSFTGNGITDGGANNPQATFNPASGLITLDAITPITYTFTDNNGCTNSTTKKTIVHANPTVNAGVDQAICNGQSIAIGGSPTASSSSTSTFFYAWSPKASLSDSTLSNPIASPTSNATYNLTVTDGNGCKASATTHVDVNAPATVDAGPATKTICSSTPLDLSTLSGANFGGSASSANWSLTSGPSTGDFKDGVPATNYAFGTAETFTPTPTDIANGGVTIRLTTDDPDGTGPCPVAFDDVVITITANPAPPSFKVTGNLPGKPSKTNVQYYCVTPNIAGSTNPLEAVGSGIKWYNNPNYLGASTNNPFPTGITTLKDTVAVFYATQTVAGCESVYATDTLVVNPAPIPDFDILKFCEGDTTEFTDLSTLVYNNGLSGTIQYWEWNFRDATRVGPDLGGTVITGSSNTFGTFKDPKHAFGVVGVYDVNLRVTTSDGCVNSIDASATTFGLAHGNAPLRIGKVPVANFNYSEICEGDNTAFDYLQAQNPAAADMKSFAWDFDDPASGVNNTSVIPDPAHTYSAFNTYMVKLKLTSNLDCVDSIVKPVYILPYITDFTNPYIESFETANHGWVHEGLATDFRTQTIPDSWNLINFTTNPESVINSAANGNYAFITSVGGTYLNNERSVLYGPCVDLTQLPRPALSFAYWNNTQAKSDGVYVETSIDNGNTWQTLGSDVSGLRWYNESSIGGLTSQPKADGSGQIGQSINQFGFSGNTGAWTDGKFSLDNLASQTKIRFRFVFGSNGDNPPLEELNGFAMDYFKLDSRNRVVLVENFTNETETINNTAFNLFKQISTNTEVVKLQYHTTLEGPDAINAENPADPNARVAFYGITGSSNTDLVPRAYLDGYSQGNFMQPWVQNYYSLRSLEDAPFNITINTYATDPATIEVDATVTATLDLKPTDRPILRAAIVEKTIGTNEYVLRKFLPSAAGYPLYDINNPTDPIQVSDPAIVTPKFSWTVDNEAVDQSNLAVIVFIQDQTPNLQGIRQVYQTAIDLNPVITPAVITAISDEEYSNRISAYPNPADAVVNVLLPAPASKATPVKLIDNYGRTVYEGLINTGLDRKSIDTKDMRAGMYFLEVKTPQGNTARKKIIVVHD